MHPVPRSPEPAFFAQIRSICQAWPELDGPDRQRIRKELEGDFNRVCVYCEQPCMPITRPHSSKYEESIDHYKPRHRFPNLWLDWLNLVYACWRCNHEKGSKWPVPGDATNQSLTAAYPQYQDVSEYLSPNQAPNQSSNEEYVGYDHSTGDIVAGGAVGSVEWSIAKRTIVDIDLNDIGLGQYDRSRLPTRRLVRLGLLVRNINQLSSIDEKIAVMRSFAQPDKPFSTFIRTWISRSFPEVL